MFYSRSYWVQGMVPLLIYGLLLVWRSNLLPVITSSNLTQVSCSRVNLFYKSCDNSPSPNILKKISKWVKIWFTDVSFVLRKNKLFFYI